MADKKTQRMAEFYEQCRAKGYTNMHDDKQSLKAKVIATDLKLNYGDIVAFYEKAKQAKAQVDREKAEEAERQRIQRQEKAKEDARRAVKGELLVTISDSVRESYGAKVIRVYIRPDGSIYSTLNNGDKIEGSPTVGAKTGGAMLLTYHPSKAVYTGASVGGVTTGGVHYTKEYYTHRTTSSAKGDVAARLGETEFTVAVITLSDYTAKLFKRDGAYKNLVYDGQIQCYNESSIANTYVDAAFSGLGDYATSMNALSMAAEARRLPYDTCSSIANLLGRVVHGQFPPTDDQTYASAAALANANDSVTLRRAYETFESISDYKDAAKQAKIVRSKYDEVLQEEKERAILEKEARKKRAKKTGIVLGIIIAIAIAVAVLLNAVIIPGIKYNNAKALMKSGQYGEAIAAFEAMDGYRDSDAQIEACHIAILDGKYADAAALMANGQYEESIVAFEAMDGYRDSDAQIEACKTAILDGKYADAAALMANGQYEEAIVAFEAMNGYKDSRGKISECHAAIIEVEYSDASALLEAGNVVEAYKALISLDGYKDSAEKAASIYVEYEIAKIGAANVGDYVPFGKYEQDNNATNGKEEIEWLVLEKRNDKVLVVSRYALDCQQYNKVKKDITWEECTLRSWLNNKFLATAFSETEQTMIPTVTVSADENPKYNTEPGNATQDKVFLLSLAEKEKYFGFDTVMLCQATEYAVENGALVFENGYCGWWLRTPGYSQDRANYVGSEVVHYGIGYGFGNDVNFDSYTVRPALWIDLAP